MRSLSTVRVFLAVLAAGVAAPALAEDAGETAVTVAPVAPLSAQAAAFRDALRSEIADLPDAQRAAIDGFFADRGYAPFWTEPASARTGALIEVLEASPEQGLPFRRYDPGSLEVMFNDPDAPPAMREVVAARTYLLYAGDLSAGVVSPSAIEDDIAPRPVRPTPAALLARLDTGSVPDVLRGLEPAAPDYRRLVAEKVRLETLGQSQAWGPAVSDGETLHPGDSGPRVAELRGRLARLGYLQASGEPGPDFDPALQAAVERFQGELGLEADGVVGARTLAAINAPVETRMAQVIVNLERLRWLNRDLGDRYIYVNIPEFTARLVDGDAIPWESKVVVGKTDVTETPEFSGMVRTIVVNPTWHIPDSIAIRDYLPKLQRNPMVLKNQGIDLMTRRGTVINPRLVDFTQYTPANFPFRIKQRPSDDNALGQVKFLFPNEFSVYMHDTPHKEYFARDVRAYSNGCIRLQKPVELAEVLLAGQVPDPGAAYQGWVAARKEKGVQLRRPIPVHIVYRTVTFGQHGAPRYRADVYGRDAKVFRALEEAGVTLPAAQG